MQRQRTLDFFYSYAGNADFFYSYAGIFYAWSKARTAHTQLFCSTFSLENVRFICIYVRFLCARNTLVQPMPIFSILQLRRKSQFFGPDDDVTLLDRIAAAGREATDLQRLDWLGQEDLVTALVEGRKAAGISQQKISYALNLGTIHDEATIIRLAAQGHTNEAIATLLDTTEGTIKSRRQRIRTWLMALAEKNGVANLVEEWDKSGGDHRKACAIRNTYPGGLKPESAS
jgi:hypothetical protein